METILLKLPNTVSVALMVIAGNYGNGNDRVKKLKAEGYNYTKVQNCVNELLNIMEKYK